MAQVTVNADSPLGDQAPARRGPSVGAALVIAVIGGIAATAATMLVLRNSYNTAIEASLAAIALIAFGVSVYGLMQAILALIDTAGERRRQDREVSERRQGERARRPKNS